MRSSISAIIIIPTAIVVSHFVPATFSTTTTTAAAVTAATLIVITTIDVADVAAAASSRGTFLKCSSCLERFSKIEGLWMSMKNTKKLNKYILANVHK